MGRFMQMVSHNLSDSLFGIWLIGMGIVFWVQPGSEGIRAFLNVVLGVILAAAGVCSLFGR
jgi:hypothetical protein